MAIAAIYVLILFTLAILYFGFSKEDSTLLLFGSILLFFTSLNIVIYGFQDLNRQYSIYMGLISMGIAGYISIRTAIETLGK